MFRKVVFAWICLPVIAFCETCQPKEKAYVQLDELIFDSNGIWFKNPGDSLVLGTEALYVDSLGYYVTKDQITWKCPQCGYINKGTHPYGCAKCDWPY